MTTRCSSSSRHRSILRPGRGQPRKQNETERGFCSQSTTRNGLSSRSEEGEAAVMGQQSGSLSPPPDGSAHRKEVSSRRDARKETTELLLLWSLRGTFCCSGCQPLNLLRTAESSSSRSSCWNFLLQQLARLYILDSASRVTFSPYASIFITCTGGFMIREG